MTNKTNTFPKLTAAQERAWQMVLDWHKKHGKVYAGFTPAGHSNFCINIAGVFGITETEATIKALAKKGMLVSVGKGLVPKAPWMECYTIHPDYIPAAPASEPAPAAAPAPVNNTPVEPEAKFKVGDKVALSHEADTMRIISSVNHDRWGRLCYRLEKTDVHSGYTLYAEGVLHPYIADPRDTRISELEARITELETELAEESADLEATAIRETQLAKRIAELEGDMERLAASELELVQQNALLNSVVDRLGQRAAMLETENAELKARLAENHIQTAEERAADWGKWNKGS